MTSKRKKNKRIIGYVYDPVETRKQAEKFKKEFSNIEINMHGEEIYIDGLSHTPGLCFKPIYRND